MPDERGMTKLATFPRSACDKCEGFCTAPHNLRIHAALFLPSLQFRFILQMARSTRVSALSRPPHFPPYFVH